MEDEKQEQSLSSEEKFSRFLSRRKSSLKEQDKANEQQEVKQFVLDLLDNYEVEVPGAGKGVVGKRIRHLFSEAQRVCNLCEFIVQYDSQVVRYLQRGKIHICTPIFLSKICL